MARAKRNLGELWQPLAKRRHAPAAEKPALEGIWHVIATIPRGRVCSYGEVARAAGFPGHARQSAYALRMAPKELHLPWHRVLGAGGRIVFPPRSANFCGRAGRLRGEGVRVVNGRVPRETLLQLEPL